MQKSILSFFSKVPEKKSTLSINKENEDAASTSKCKNALRQEHPEDSDDEQLPNASRTKRRRVILESSDEENPAHKPQTVLNKKRNIKELYSCSPKTSLKDSTNSSEVAPCSVGSKPSALSHKGKSISDTSSSDLLNTSIADSCFVMDPLEKNREGSWLHLSYPFLQPDRIKDACGRRPNHPEYDPRTLYVPEEFIRRQSPAMRQWWIMKSQHFDTLLFFKMGKFYELYHMDAVIVVDELKISYMKGEVAHAGFPEIAFQKMADHLLHRGYKVARVEQTETPEGMARRTSGKSGVDKVVRREICQIIAPGTWFAPLRNPIAGDATSDASFILSGSQATTSVSQPVMETDLSFSRHLLVILEGTGGAASRAEPQFGVALLKAATGEIMIGQFTDDIHYSRICTTIAHFPPSQVLFERGNLNSKLHHILKARLPSVPFEGLAGGKQFLSARETICSLESANYFGLTGRAGHDASVSSHPTKVDCWPVDLLRMLDPNDALGRSPLPEYELAVRCLGAVVFYLRYCLADTEILSLGLIHEYRPVDLSGPTVEQTPFYERQVNMVLDSVTLENLEVLANSFNGSLEGTLLERVDNCCTSFGRRLLRSWVVNPPCHPTTIGERQDAVQELMDLGARLQPLRDALRRLPDLERLLTKVHIMGWNATRPDHPESRAVVVDETIYSKRKILDFLTTLSGFKAAAHAASTFAKLGVQSTLLRSLTSLQAEGGAFPDYGEQLALFNKAFDHEKAKRDGCIVVEPGFDPEFDLACENLKRAEQDMDDFLAEQSRLIGYELTYVGSGKNRYQVEVPEEGMGRVPRAWEATGQRRGYRRFRPPAITDLLTRLLLAEDAKQDAMQGIMRRLFASFSASFANWQAAVKCIAQLDCLMSLANYSLSAAAITCRPVFYPLDAATKPFLEIEGGHHPCLVRSFGGGELTPNDMRLGLVPDQEGTETTREGFKTGATTLLITGPNMGGKSTLMRQTALLAILAHLGCQIPATSCRLTPLDRVFTRIGASDRLVAGQSTFYVELAETAVILGHATPNSLVLMDELGRGTSTRDGTALAAAVLRRLAVTRPLTLFSTHYHGLVDSLRKSRDPLLFQALDVGHMACLVGDGEAGEKGEDDEEGEVGSGMQKITFLYKFVPSACPKSYGFNVAHLAQIPDEIISEGVVMAKEFEKVNLVFSCLRDVLSGKMSRDQALAWQARLKKLTRQKMHGGQRATQGGPTAK